MQAANLNEVLEAVVDADDGHLAGVVLINAIAKHREQAAGYVTNCVLPCGCEGCIVQFVLRNEDDESEVIWVH